MDTSELNQLILRSLATKKGNRSDLSIFEFADVSAASDGADCFEDCMFGLQKSGHVAIGDVYSGSEGETCFIDVVASRHPETKRIVYGENVMARLSPAELRVARDKVIRYIYENGAANHGYSMPVDDIVANTEVDSFSLRDVLSVLINQQLLSETELQSIGLNLNGQREAERLGPAVLMQMPQSTQSLQIDARYSIVQIAGSHSTQSATQTTNHSELMKVLDEIEAEIQNLEVPSAVKEEAKGLLASLKESAAKGVNDAVTRAVGGALGSILTAAGSPLGRGLLVLLGISA